MLQKKESAKRPGPGLGSENKWPIAKWYYGYKNKNNSDLRMSLDEELNSYLNDNKYFMYNVNLTEKRECLFILYILDYFQLKFHGIISNLIVLIKYFSTDIE